MTMMNNGTTTPNTGAATDKSMPVRTTRSVAESPGALRGESWMTLQTREAQRLVNGRAQQPGKPAIIGLTRFGGLMSQLFFSARLDDAYVDWWLVQIEEAFLLSKKELDGYQHKVGEKLNSQESIEFEVAMSVEPIRIPLRFSNPYSYRAAALVASYDKLVRSSKTGRHTGTLTRDEDERFKDLGGTAVRRCLSSPANFPRGIVASREDLRQQSARAKQAVEKYGLPPEDIVSGERRGEYAPAIMSINDSRLKANLSLPLDQDSPSGLDQEGEQPEAL
jgi:integrating conjugative element protein (TIGR03761 family)